MSGLDAPRNHALIAEWLTDQQHRLKPDTLASYGKIARLAAARIDLSTCTAPEVAEAVTGTWRTPAGRDNATRVMRALFRWMSSNGLREDNPVPAVRHSVAGTGPARIQPPPAWVQHIDAWQRYLLAIGRSEETRHTYRRTVVAFAHANPDGPQVPGEALIDYYADHPDWMPATRKGVKKALTDFYTWAEPRGIIPEGGSPTNVLPVMRVPDAVPRPAPEHTYRQALADAGPREHLMLLIAAHGLRVREIAAVHSDDLTDHGLRVTGKGGRTRLVPITSELRGALIGNGPGWVFPSPAKPGRHLAAGTIGRNLSRALGPEATAHMLRHRFGTRAYQAGNNLRAVQILLGHADVATTCIYVAVDDADLIDAVEAAAS